MRSFFAGTITALLFVPVALAGPPVTTNMDPGLGGSVCTEGSLMWVYPNGAWVCRNGQWVRL